nr:MAG TPA: hypothetical protein [Caudoviricetes sp.]
MMLFITLLSSDSNFIIESSTTNLTPVTTLLPICITYLFNIFYKKTKVHLSLSSYTNIIYN